MFTTGVTESEFAKAAKHIIRTTMIHVHNLYSTDDATEQLWIRALDESALLPQEVQALSDIVERRARDYHISRNGLIEFCKVARNQGFTVDSIYAYIRWDLTSQATLTRVLFQQGKHGTLWAAQFRRGSR